MDVLKGTLEAFIETGSEGHHWSFHETVPAEVSAQNPYAGLRPLQKGDILVVFNDSAMKQEIWRGVVDFNYKTHVVSLRAKNPGFGALIRKDAKAQWIKNIGAVHGAPVNANPRKWAEMFLQEKPALLIPASTPKNPG